jgi:hypothetical protein
VAVSEAPKFEVDMPQSRFVLPPFLCSLAILCPASEAADTDLQVTVHLYDYTRMQPAALVEAKHIAEAPLRRANIQVRWSDCPGISSATTTRASCGANTGDPTHLVVVALPESMSRKLNFRPQEFGAAVSGHEVAFPTQAYVFVDRITDFANGESMPWIPILGAIITHEIGHLLLGNESHSPGGIMCRSWRPEQIKMARMQVLTFTPRQAEQMRREVRRRMREP